MLNKKSEMWKKVILGFILGGISGILIPDYVIHLKFFGDIFLKLIKLIIAPLVFFALISGTASMNDTTTLSRVGLKATIAFLATTIFAAAFGLAIGTILKPGLGANIYFDHSNLFTPVKEFSLSALLLDIIPSNPLSPVIEGNLIQIVFISLFCSIALNKVGDSANNIKIFCHSVSKIMMRMIEMIIQLSPYAAFSLTSYSVAVQGLAAMWVLSKLLLSIFLAMGLQYIIFGILIFCTTGLSPMPFYRKSLQYQLLAISTSSSKATLGTTMEVCRDKLGISESSTSFVLPLGASINMDGLAINLSLTAVFFAQMFNVELTVYNYFAIIITSTLGSIGGAGIPGASLIMLPMVLSSISLPIEGVALMAGIDRLLDMFRTVINITGDATITLIIDKSEKTLDVEKYYSE